MTLNKKKHNRDFCTMYAIFYQDDRSQSLVFHVSNEGNIDVLIRGLKKRYHITGD